MTGDAWVTGVQQVAASYEDIITHEDVGTYGWVYLKNIGTNASIYVDFAHTADDDDKLCRLYGGESCILKTHGLTALHAKSSSGTQGIEYAIIEL